MGLDSIINEHDREKWSILIKKTHQILSNAGYNNIMFRSFKNDGSYAKAQTGIKSSNWAFAKDKSRFWVELELKPISIDEKKHVQSDLYSFIKSEYKKKGIKVIWDEDDRRTSPRRIKGKDLRIKIYLKEGVSYLEDEKKQIEWVLTMLNFVKEFDPIIQKK